MLISAPYPPELRMRVMDEGRVLNLWVKDNGFKP